MIDAEVEDERDESLGVGCKRSSFKILQVHMKCSMKCLIFCSVRMVIIHLLFA